MNGMLQPNNAFNFQYYQPSTGRYIDPSLMDADEVSRQFAGGELVPASQAPQPEMPMYQPQPMPDFPTEIGGTPYPQFNLGYNPFMGMFSGLGNYDQFGNFNLYNQMMPQQVQMQQPTSYSAMTRYYSPAASSGFDQRDINNMSYDQLVSAARTGRLNYNDPNAPQQTSQQGMFNFGFPAFGYGRNF
jgi:hypothetical protein